jgi:hypothetical protein
VAVAVEGHELVRIGQLREHRPRLGQLAAVGLADEITAQDIESPRHLRPRLVDGLQAARLIVSSTSITGPGRDKSLPPT